MQAKIKHAHLFYLGIDDFGHRQILRAIGASNSAAIWNYDRFAFLVGALTNTPPSLKEVFQTQNMKLILFPAMKVWHFRLDDDDRLEAPKYLKFYKIWWIGFSAECISDEWQNQLLEIQKW